MKITKGAILSALLFLTSLATLAENIKATVKQGTTTLETAVLSPGTDGLLCSFVDGKLVITKGTTNVAELPMRHGAAMEIESTSALSSNRTVEFTPDGYATIYSAFQITIPSTIPSGVEVYAPTLSGNELVLTYKTRISGTIPAATGVIVKKTGTPVNFTYTVTTTELPNTTSNVLSGTVLATPTSDAEFTNQTIYTLDNKGSGSAFFKYTPDETKACRAFLLQSSSHAKGITFKFDDDPTGISDIEVESNTADGRCYNLSGQRVNSNTKGIVIIGGKKYINR